MNDVYLWGISIGISIGFLSRILMLQTDYRQYPTYPHGYIIHLSLGLIAAALGSVAVPALLEKNFTAVTFLTIAAQQFRDVRNMERETLNRLDEMELVPRGGSYIEGIAMVFEGRNYLVMLTSLISSFTVILLESYGIGILVGFVMIVITYFLKTGQVIGEIAQVEEAPLRIEGPNLYVDNIYLMNIGLTDNKERILKQGVGVILKPRHAASRVTLANIGQRQAILYDASVILGAFRDTGEPALVPIAKRDLKDGRLGVLLLLQDEDRKEAVKIIERVPVLESAVRKPTQFD